MLHNKSSRFSPAIAALVLASAAFGSELHAYSLWEGDNPVVSGNTIQLPTTGGWFQVQTTTDYSSVCEGKIATCVVDNGIYLVVDHTNQTRWERVEVGELPTGRGFEVTGNTINFTGSGWFQVQDSSTYQNICAGVRSCDVPDGLVNVINHTTGERFEKIVVSGGKFFEKTDQCEGNVYVSGTVTRDITDTSWSQPFIKTDDAHVRIRLSSWMIDLASTTLVERDVPFEEFPFDFTICADAENIETLRNDRMLSVSIEVHGSEGFTAHVGDLVSEIANDIDGPTTGLLVQLSGLEHCNAEYAGGFCTNRVSATNKLAPMSDAICQANGGIRIDDPGDGSAFNPAFRCDSGQPPIANINDEFFTSDEGSVCCI